jgi:hypothetical protein
MDSTVRNWLRNESVARLTGIELYLFGSVRTSKNPNDVDLLIVYDPSHIDIDIAISTRWSLQRKIHEITGAPADIVLLSTREVEQTKFLNRIDAERLN